MQNKIKRSTEDRVIDYSVYGVLILVSFAMLYPLLNVFAVSLSDYGTYIKYPMMIFPRKIDFSAFSYVFTNKLIFSGYRNSIFVAGMGTVLGLFLTGLTAYPLSRKDLVGKKFLMTFYMFVFVFHAGMIPTFLVMQKLGLYDSLWALVVPMLIPIYHLVLMKSFFESIPESLIESAKIDGATELKVFFSIILPLSKPALAAIGLFQLVLYWNNYMNAVLFIRSMEKWPLQLLLREIILAADASFMGSAGNLAEIDANAIPAKSVQYASLIVVILPIVCIYPFVQKYFVQGVMVGAVKG